MKQLTKKQMAVLLKNTVVKDKQGAPLKVYRGEHSPLDTSDTGVKTLLGSLSFGDAQTASTYACEPNNSTHTADSPRIYGAYLIMNNPFFNDGGDPFIDFSHVEARLGKQLADHFFLKHAASAENTNNWQEEIDPDNEWGSIAEFHKHHPERMNELYMELYYLLDDPEFVNILKEKGFDGAIYSGSGANGGEDEFRVFDKTSIIYAISREIEPKPRRELSLEQGGLAA